MGSWWFSHNYINVCLTCENKGCGSYHDVCEKYQAEREKLRRVNSAKFENEHLNGYTARRVHDARLKKWKGR